MIIINSFTVPSVAVQNTERVNDRSIGEVLKIDNYFNNQTEANFSAALFGGSEYEEINEMTVDGNGSVYIVGTTCSPDLPTTSNAFDPTHNNDRDIFVAKYYLNQSLAFLTYLGGFEEDSGQGIALDSNGDILVTGYSESTDFPVVHAFQPEKHDGNDAFLCKLSNDGSSLLYSTFIGGEAGEVGFSVVIDDQDQPVITGYSNSETFPITSGSYMSDSPYAAFISKFFANGSDLVFSARIGGFAHNRGMDIEFDNQGNIIVVGLTRATDFPVLENAFLTSPSNGFVSKLSSNGSALLYSSYIDHPYSVKLDSHQNIVIAGFENGHIPVNDSSFLRYPSHHFTPYCMKFNSNFSSVIFTTLFGGTGHDYLRDLYIDPSDNIYLTRSAGTVDFPTTYFALQHQTTETAKNAYLVVFSPRGYLRYSTVFGGDGSESGNVILGYNDTILIGGTTSSIDFPINPQTNQSSEKHGNAFILRTNFSLSDISIQSPNFHYRNSEIITLNYSIQSDNRLEISHNGQINQTNTPSGTLYQLEEGENRFSLSLYNETDHLVDRMSTKVIRDTVPPLIIVNKQNGSEVVQGHSIGFMVNDTSPIDRSIGSNVSMGFIRMANI